VSMRSRHQRVVQVLRREVSAPGKLRPCVRVGDHAGEA
jgi:hypothetical protein